MILPTQWLFGNATKIHGKSGDLPLPTWAGANWNYIGTRVRLTPTTIYIYLLISWFILTYLDLCLEVPNNSMRNPGQQAHTSRCFVSRTQDWHLLLQGDEAWYCQWWAEEHELEFNSPILAMSSRNLKGISLRSSSTHIYLLHLSQYLFSTIFQRWTWNVTSSESRMAYDCILSQAFSLLNNEFHLTSIICTRNQGDTGIGKSECTLF